LWCNTLLQCGGGGLPLGLRMNGYKGKNSLLRSRCSCAQCVARDWLKIRCLRLRCLLVWWLVLFIEALVLSPNIEREGIQQWRANLKGDS